MTELEIEGYDSLTPREKQVFHLKDAHYSAREIGQELNISTRTAEDHWRNIKQKLGIKRLSELDDILIPKGDPVKSKMDDLTLKELSEMINSLDADVTITLTFTRDKEWQE